MKRGYKIIFMLLITATGTQSMFAQEFILDTINTNINRETRIILSTDRINYNPPKNYNVSKQGSNSLIITPKNANTEPEDFVLQEGKVWRKLTIEYKERVVPMDEGDFEYDYSSKDVELQQQNENTILFETGKGSELSPNFKPQTKPIPYDDIGDLYKRFPGMMLGTYPAGQVFNLIDRPTDANHRSCETFLEEKSSLNIIFSNNLVGITLVCQDIKIDGENGYMKLLIQNGGDADFLTGIMTLTWKKKADNTSVTLYPGYIMPGQLPIVQPGKQYPLIYPFKAFNIADEDELKFELHDRQKKINVEFTLHGADYNVAKNNKQ